MSETLDVLAVTLQEIEDLERQLDEQPTTDAATRLSASKQVALALGRKLEREEAQQQRQADDTKRRQLEARYAEVNEKVDDLYREAEAGLSAALDATDAAYPLHNESRRLASMITKLGGNVPIIERNFWSRNPKLRDRFLDSVLRNGEP